MEFWGVEVKAGEPVKVDPEPGRVIHISQAALGEGKKEKANDIVPLRLKIDGKNFVVGSLSGEKFPQVTFDLVFEKEFELSHGWKNGSVYFCGYSAENPFDEEDVGFDSDSEDEDEDIPAGVSENGTIGVKVEEPMAVGKAGKPGSSAKPKVTVVEPKKDEADEDDDDSEEDDDESDDDKEMKDVFSDSDDDDESEDEDEDEDEEDTPKKVAPSKKRPTESATKTPVPAKKAKLDTPQKTGADGKKGGVHTATPHPSKKPAKSPAKDNKSNEKTPKSKGNVSCKTCNRTFNSDQALDSHSKAKHGDK